MSAQQTPMLFPYDPEQFWKEIRELVRAEIERAKGNNVQYEVPGMTQKPLYKGHEVCQMLQISRQTLHSWVKEGILKPYKIKSRVFFLWSDLEKLISNNEK